MLRERACEAVVVPLYRIVPLPHQSHAVEADAVVATSANALAHLDTALAVQLQSLPLFAVGAATAAAAHDAGFRAVTTGPGDAAGLAGLVAGTAGIRRIAYLCGRTRKPAMEKSLAAACISVTTIETYATDRRDPTTGERAAMAAAPLDAVLVYSHEAAKAVAALHGDVELRPALAGALHVCMSADCADPLPAGLRVVIADAPTADAMLAVLDAA